MTGNDPDGTGKRSVRHYSADYMEAYLRDLVGRYGYRSIYFDDDTFNLGNSHVVRMCEVMARIGLPWSAMCRADTIRMETWKLMREAGGVIIGKAQMGNLAGGRAQVYGTTTPFMSFARAHGAHRFVQRTTTLS